MRIAQSKGVNFNSLLPTGLEHIDKISTALDHCVEVRLYNKIPLKKSSAKNEGKIFVYKCPTIDFLGMVNHF